MRDIDYEERMEIVMQMLYWAWSRGVDRLQELSIIYIQKGYDPKQVLSIEIAARNLFYQYFS